MDINSYQSDQITAPVKRYGLRGGIIGLVVAAILATVTTLICDSSCNESPIYYGVFLAFPLFFIIGAIAGSCWKNRMARIIMLAILGFIVVWFLIGYISEFSG